jgi:hypothetical protein
MRLTAPSLTGTTTIRTTRTTISGSGLSAPELCTLRLSNAEPANWPKTNEASCGRKAANFEWHLPAGTKRERRKVLLLIGRKKKTSNNQFNLTIPVVMVCAGRFARHKPRQALRAGIAG